MSDAREDSPDWLRSFQPPVTTLSSDSEPSGDKTPVKHEKEEKEDDSVSDVMQSDANKSSKKKTAKKQVKFDDETPAKRRKTKRPKKSGKEDHEDVEEEDSDEPVKASAPNHSIWALSSDSESDAKVSTSKEEANEESSSQKSLELLNKEEKNDNAEITPKVAAKRKSPKKKVKTEDVKPKEEKKTNDSIKIDGEGGNVDVPKEVVVPEKHADPRVTSMTLPLVLPEKVNRSKALIECEGESIDLSGDMGAVGRVVIADTPSKEPEMYLDLKGTIYKTTIVPSRTFCVVSIGQSEAKIEAVMNDIIQLAPQSNVYDAETMVEGTLEGFSFDSEDEADKTVKDPEPEQAEGDEEKSNAKSKGKAVKKTVATQEKGKAAGSKLPKKKKPQAPKKGRAKK